MVITGDKQCELWILKDMLLFGMSTPRGLVEFQLKMKC